MSKLPSSVLYAVCYIRKSREDEEAELRGEDTLMKQRELMVRDVLSRYEFDYDIAEEVASGDSIRDRPVFRKLLPELGVKYQAIVCKDLSRLGRGSYGDMGMVYDIIRDKRIFIITKDAVYDPRNFSDLRMIRFSLFFNREEYEMTVWRLTEGKYDGAQRGKWVAGSVPYGFRYDPKLQVLVPHPDDAQIVQMIFHWYVREELGFNAIATRFKRLGIKTPRGKDRWQPEVIHRMLLNTAYKGTLLFRKTQRNKIDGKVVQRPVDEHIIVENAFEAIVDADTWERAQARLTDVRQRQLRVKYDFSPSELASLVTCSKCSKKMVRQLSTQRYKKRDGTISRYEKEFLYCTHCGYSVKYRDCESQLLRVLEKMATIELSTLEAHLIKLRGHFQQETKVDTSNLRKQIEERKKALENRLVRAREFLLDETFTKADFEAARDKYQKDLNELLQSERNLEEQLPVNELTQSLDVQHIQAQINTVLETYLQIEDKSAKNRLLRGLFDQVVLHLMYKGTGKNNPTRFDLFVRLNSSLLSV